MLDTLQLSRSNVNSVVRSYLSPTSVGAGVEPIGTLRDNCGMSSTLQLSRSNVNSMVPSYLSPPTQVGASVEPIRAARLLTPFCSSSTVGKGEGGVGFLAGRGSQKRDQNYASCKDQPSYEFLELHLIQCATRRAPGRVNLVNWPYKTCQHPPQLE